MQHDVRRQSAIATTALPLSCSRLALSRRQSFDIECSDVVAARCVMPNTQNRHYPRRPKRLEWLFSNVRPLYFVTFNTYKRLPLLARPEIHSTFRSFCFRAKERRIAVGRYILMPDHVHLFVALPEQDLTLEKWIQALRSVIGKQLLRLGAQKPHWQESFFDHLLRSQESYSQKWDYVRMNAVRAYLCETPESWPYQGEIVSLGFD